MYAFPCRNTCMHVFPCRNTCMHVFPCGNTCMHIFPHGMHVFPRGIHICMFFDVEYMYAFRRGIHVCVYFHVEFMNACSPHMYAFTPMNITRWNIKIFNLGVKITLISDNLASRLQLAFQNIFLCLDPNCRLLKWF